MSDYLFLMTEEIKGLCRSSLASINPVHPLSRLSGLTIHELVEFVLFPEKFLERTFSPLSTPIQSLIKAIQDKSVNDIQQAFIDAIRDNSPFVQCLKSCLDHPWEYAQQIVELIRQAQRKESNPVNFQTLIYTDRINLREVARQSMFSLAYRFQDQQETCYQTIPARICSILAHGNVCPNVVAFMKPLEFASRLSRFARDCQSDLNMSDLSIGFGELVGMKWNLELEYPNHFLPPENSHFNVILQLAFYSLYHFGDIEFSDEECEFITIVKTLERLARSEYFSENTPAIRVLIHHLMSTYPPKKSMPRHVIDAIQKMDSKDCKLLQQIGLCPLDGTEKIYMYFKYNQSSNQFAKKFKIKADSDKSASLPNQMLAFFNHGKNNKTPPVKNGLQIKKTWFHQSFKILKDGKDYICQYGETSIHNDRISEVNEKQKLIGALYNRINSQSFSSAIGSNIKSAVDTTLGLVASSLLVIGDVFSGGGDAKEEDDDGDDE